MRIHALPWCRHALRYAPFMLLPQIGGVRLEIVNRGSSTIRSNPYVIFAANIEGVLDVRNDIGSRGMAAPIEEGHEIDSDESAPISDQPQLLIGLVARQVHESTASRMVDRDRLLREARRIETGRSEE